MLYRLHKSEVNLNTIVWVSTNAQLFLPCAVIDATDKKFLTVAVFDVKRPGELKKAFCIQKIY